MLINMLIIGKYPAQQKKQRISAESFIKVLPGGTLFPNRIYWYTVE